MGISIILFLMLTSTVHTNALPVYSEKEGPPYPSLQIIKWIDVTEDHVKVGQTINVYVNITNFGGSAAFNVTIVEPIFQNFSISNLEGYNPKNWVRMDPGASVFYSFQFAFEKAGNYTIEPTTAQYTDAELNDYSSKSGFFDLKVLKGNPPISKKDEWKFAFSLMGGFIALPVIWLIAKKYIIDK